MCDLQWLLIEFATGTMHAPGPRAAGGYASLQGDELPAIRELKRQST
jgi:hypothetical protein